jgi:hypothetical protein
MQVLILQHKGVDPMSPIPMEHNTAEEIWKEDYQRREAIEEKDVTMKIRTHIYTHRIRYNSTEL